MKFKMNKVATAVAASLGVSVVGMNVAQSDEVLFPYVVASPTVTTILSVINDGAATVDTSTLQYRYFQKTQAGTSADKASGCSEIDVIRPSSRNDVVTFDVQGVFGSDTLSVLFEDPASTINANYTAANQNFGALRNEVKPLRAFAIAENNSAFNPTVLPGIDPVISPTGLAVLDDTEASVHGEAFVLEFSSGAAWGYRAYNPAGIYANVAAGGATATVRLNPYDFSDRVENNGEVISSRRVTSPDDRDPFRGDVATSLLPFAEEGGEFNTRLFVTPVSTFQLNGALSTTVSFTVAGETGSDVGSTDVIFDRDENPISGQVPMTVTCVAALNAADMLTLGARGEAPFGGWTNVRVTDPGTGANQVGDAVVFKLEFNETGGTFNNEPFTQGAFNNAIWLRSGIRESIIRTPLTLGNVTVGNSINVFTVGDDDNSPCPLLPGAAVGIASQFCPGL